VTLSEVWRLIVSEPAEGPENMAVDEAILEQVGERAAPPTLRFYEWRSPWVSLGSGQPASDLDRAALETRGWGVLRRASGGTGVLHQHQLGYALVLPTSHPIWRGDLITSYEHLAKPLRAALAALGIEAEPASATLRAQAKSSAPALAERSCFAALGPFELLVGGKKVIGNSQVRRRSASTQHGVIQLTGNQSALVDVLAGASPVERRALADYLTQRAGPVSDGSVPPISAAKLIVELVRAFEDTFEVRIEPGQLSVNEEEQAACLVVTKYGEPTWTFRR
jgi:lipoate-protein ligase A